MALKTRAGGGTGIGKDAGPESTMDLVRSTIVI